MFENFFLKRAVASFLFWTGWLFLQCCVPRVTMASGYYNSVTLTVRVALLKRGMQQNLWQDSQWQQQHYWQKAFGWSQRHTARNYSPEMKSSVFIIHLGWFIMCSNYCQWNRFIDCSDHHSQTKALLWLLMNYIVRTEENFALSVWNSEIKSLYPKLFFHLTFNYYK